jgi:hypothetical protein
MKRGAFLAALLLGVVLGLQGVGAAELRWEIERNFRYFLYPSDVESNGSRATSMRPKTRSRQTLSSWKPFLTASQVSGRRAFRQPTTHTERGGPAIGRVAKT